jgi:hypothetical protein
LLRDGEGVTAPFVLEEVVDPAAARHSE